MGNIQSIPVSALRPTSRQILSGALDIQRDAMHNGRLSDYRGFLELAQLSCAEIDEIEEQRRLNSSPTQCFLRRWPRQATARGLEPPTIETGLRILRELGREDIIQALHRTVGRKCITVDDAKWRTRITYDALLMSVLSDQRTLNTLIAEGSRHGLKFLVPDRDLLPGLPVYDTLAYAVEKRCRKLVLLISKDFMESESCDFVVKFATALSPAAYNRKIIPIKIGDIQIHPTLNFVSCFTVNSDSCWSLLISAIKSPALPNMEHSISYPGSLQVANVPPMRRPVSTTDRQTFGTDEEQCLDGIARLQTADRDRPPNTINGRGESTNETVYRRTDRNGRDRGRNSNSLAEMTGSQSPARITLEDGDYDETVSISDVSDSGSSYCVIQSVVAISNTGGNLQDTDRGQNGDMDDYLEVPDPERSDRNADSSSDHPAGLDAEYNTEPIQNRGTHIEHQDESTGSSGSYQTDQSARNSGEALTGQETADTVHETSREERAIFV